eukprot:TRINITY_DN16810_c0_g1_i1.p1 TRINITY_DN16810_c0_g1~~TRINITY_DN16810_c0_g1_i1.p1  ORF type:complete len:1181 (+),score=374.81 TRINITY_DN16810_c0_g1_i1:155-3697(+)
MDFLQEENLAGQTILRLCSRGNAIVAELLRLSDHIPSVFKLSTAEEQQRYGGILFDFDYLDKSDLYEHRIEESEGMLDLDEEFRDNHLQIINRFYKLFESIYIYSTDLNKFLEDLEDGVFIQLTLDIVLMNPDGKQLLAESVFLMGVMLLLLDERVEGIVRERMLVSYMRYMGQVAAEHLDEVCSLMRNTGYVPGTFSGAAASPQPAAKGKNRNNNNNAPIIPRPKDYPESFFSRVNMPRTFVEMVVGRLRSDDIYNQVASYPHPDHRSTALGTQACMLYVTLYFVPHILYKNQAAMREIVDKHFADNWVVSYYMGATVDLTVAWQGYKAAELALNNTIDADNVVMMKERHAEKLEDMLNKLKQLLAEGVLTEDYILDNTYKLLAVVRNANVTIRWLMLQSNTNPNNQRLRNLVMGGEHAYNAQNTLSLLLKTAQFEFVLKNSFQTLLDTKEDRWADCKKTSTEMMRELAEYFSGEKALTRVQKNENLQKWFNNIADKVDLLDYTDSTLAGRKIMQLIQALEEVEEFQEIETSLQVKSFLKDTRSYLNQMLRIVNIKEEYLVTMATVADMSYAWGVIHHYISYMQAMIKKDPRYVLLLRATFLKLSSILDLPLVRINQAQSPDLFSVSEYYSGQLVIFVRKVLEVIPRSMFDVLSDIITLQTSHLKVLPTKLEKDKLKEYAQLDQRYKLAKATHAVSVFTEGILALEKTLIGIIEVDPKQLLEDGIRTQLVYTIARTMDNILVFPPPTAKSGGGSQFESRLMQLASHLDGLRRSFQYIQDYVNIYGLKIWQEEFSRIVNFNVEQECNSFLKKKVYEWQSAFQSVAIPIPTFAPQQDRSVNFSGRLARELLRQCDPYSTVYLDLMSSWYDRSGRELVGITTFTLLLRSINVYGLRGVDKLFCFMIVQAMQDFVAKLRKEMAQKDLKEVLAEMAEILNPTTTYPVAMVYAKVSQRLAPLWASFLPLISAIGVMQLLRRQIATILNFSCKLDSNMLYCALDVLNNAITSDVQAHYLSPESKPYPSDDNPLLPELSACLETAGINDPFTKIYITTTPIDKFPLLMFFLLASQLPNYTKNAHLGVLYPKDKKRGIDGTALTVGIITLLKQFHSLHTQKFLAYLGQFVRSNINQAHKDPKNTSNDFPPDVLTLLAFLEDFCKFSHISRKSVEGYLPAYVFNAFTQR